MSIFIKYLVFILMISTQEISYFTTVTSENIEGFDNQNVEYFNIKEEYLPQEHIVMLEDKELGDENLTLISDSEVETRWVSVTYRGDQELSSKSVWYDDGEYEGLLYKQNVEIEGDSIIIEYAGFVSSKEMLREFIDKLSSD